MSLTHTPTTHDRYPTDKRTTQQGQRIYYSPAKASNYGAADVRPHHIPVTIEYKLTTQLDQLNAEATALSHDLSEMTYARNHLLAQVHAYKEQLDTMPLKILDLVTDTYGEPCDTGFSEAMEHLGLEMPPQTRTVTVEWSETITYYAEEEVECHWDSATNEYVVREDEEQTVREGAHNYADFSDYNDYSCTVEQN